MELDDGDAAISRAPVLISIEKRGIPRAVSIADDGLEILCSCRTRGGKIECFTANRERP